MTKAGILGALTGAFMNFHGAPGVADLNHTSIPVEHIDKSDVGQRHPETNVQCNGQFPC
jgi:hypothetical protein